MDALRALGILDEKTFFGGQTAFGLGRLDAFETLHEEVIWPEGKVGSSNRTSGILRNEVTTSALANFTAGELQLFSECAKKREFRWEIYALLNEWQRSHEIFIQL